MWVGYGKGVYGVLCEDTALSVGRGLMKKDINFDTVVRIFRKLFYMAKKKVVCWQLVA